MPAIGLSYEPKLTDSTDTLRGKWYMAVMSCEETAYTLGAALAECRKQLDHLDKQVVALKREFHESRLRKAARKG